MEAHNVIITKKNEVYIKIDCEGHDKEILPTLKNIIEINKPIIQTEIIKICLSYYQTCDE